MQARGQAASPEWSRCFCTAPRNLRAAHRGPDWAFEKQRQAHVRNCSGEHGSPGNCQQEHLLSLTDSGALLPGKYLMPWTATLGVVIAHKKEHSPILRPDFMKTPINIQFRTTDASS